MDVYNQFFKFIIQYLFYLLIPLFFQKCTVHFLYFAQYTSVDHKMQEKNVKNFSINIISFFGEIIREGDFDLPDIHNQNHRLSRWYAPRLQGDSTGSPTRALN